MSDKPPFEVGQRVRVIEVYRRLRWKKAPTGVVKWIEPPLRGDPWRFGWLVGVHRDGTKKGVGAWWSSRLELVPTDDLTLDQTAQALADAVKRGGDDAIVAALALADHLFEMYGGTKTEGS